MWCVPTLDEPYKERMFDVLDLYEREYDPLLPVVCLDEKSVELHDERRQPLRGRLGVRRDHEYIRRGTANLFMMTEPKGGKHYVRVTERRTKRDFAHCLAWLSKRYPNALTIHLVMDNLNTHNENALIETLGAVEGRRLWARFTVHYTPVHGSWLNQAEIAIGITQRCCLGKERIGSKQQLRQRVIPFWKNRRTERWKIDWRFTKKKAKVWIKTFESEH
jgi:hypothetical protein